MFALVHFDFCITTKSPNDAFLRTLSEGCIVIDHTVGVTAMFSIIIIMVDLYSARTKGLTVFVL